MDVRLAQLQRFVVLAEELSFTRAAARLHLSQQVLSAQVRQLETALGVRLFDRTTRHVELTPAGRVFRDRVLDGLDAIDAAVRAARATQHRDQVVVLCQVDAQWAVEEVAAGLRAAADGIDVVVLSFTDPRVVADLAEWRVDALATWTVPDGDPPRRSVVAAVEETIVVAREDDPLVAAGAVAVSALAAAPPPWMFPRGTGPEARDAMLRHAGRAGAPVRVVDAGTAPAQEAMIRAVQRHGGWTFATRRYLARTGWAGVVGVPIDPPLRMPVHLSWRGAPGRGLRRLVAHLDRSAPGSGS